MFHIDRQNLDSASSQLWSLLSPHIDYLSKKDKETVELAFTQMVVAHNCMRRKSGEFYIIHPVAACITLAKLKLDKDTLAACLLHDVPEDTEVSLTDLSKDFSPEVVFLVESVTKLSKVRYQGEERYVENLKKMFVAISKDLRVVFIKLADRLHNLQTLHFVRADKRKRIAIESMQIYAPIAEKLGIGYFRGEIEDAAFEHAYPEEYLKLTSETDLIIDKRQKEVKDLIKKTEEIFDKAGINFKSIKGRAKKYFSIYKKITDKVRHKNLNSDDFKKALADIYDLIALRIICTSEAGCYKALSVIYDNFEVMESRVKDYITRPKPNGYQSLHLTVKNPATGNYFEFQLRTPKMHDHAEFGVAAHWSYKENAGSPVSKKTKEKMALENMLSPETYKWLADLIELGKKDWGQDEYLQHVKLNLFNDRIFVMTPKNDPINLPIGAMPLDFAYKIHEEVGNHYAMAKVNGEVVKINTRLRSGDIVEIVTNRSNKPSKDWLNHVVTKQAAKQIRSNFKEAKA